MKSKKVVMNHDLAQALMKAGMEHYDLGGWLGGAINDIGSAFQGVGKAFTPQNNYNASLAPTTQVDFAPLIQTGAGNVQAGYQNAQALQGEQQGLADQLKAETMGAGPNPALSQLNETTGNNVAAQAALMAGQRGASGNAGLLARQIAQQGAATNEQAAAEAARLRAEQQLAAQQQLQAQQQAMVQGNLGQEGIQSGILNTGISGNASQNNTNVSNYGMMQGINSGVAAGNAAADQKTTGGFLNGLGGVAGTFLNGKVGGTPGHYKGGVIDGYSNGGKVPDHLKSIGHIYHPEFMRGKSQIPAMLSGGKVPGRAPVKGDSPKNDTKLTLMSSGEGVIPRSIMNAKDAPKKAAEFVKALKEGKNPKEAKEDTEHELKGALKAKKGNLNDRVARLEKLCYGGKAS